MNKRTQNVLRYWRASLADSALGKGKFKQADRKRFIEVPFDALEVGILPKKYVDQLFRDQPAAQAMSVRLWPLVTARQLSHGTERGDGLPDIVAPVVTDATVDRDGQISPVRNTLARDVLTPLPNDEFSIGSVEDLDAFLTEVPLPEMASADRWQHYRKHCRNMLNTVAQEWPRNNEDYRPIGIGFLELSNNASATVSGILKLYDKLLTENSDTPLLNQIAQPTIAAEPNLQIENELSRRLGHSNPKFPLAEHQRQVLAWLDASSSGEVIAVNGPPGTGKTTMLLSAVAGMWVRAAIEGKDPPIIVAASSNNQAVTNIIDAFGKDFAAGEGPFAGHWLPDIKSFGIFLPSYSLQEEASKRYQTEDFQKNCEAAAYVQRAGVVYLEAAKSAFPNLANPDLKSVVSALHELITIEARKLTRVDKASTARQAAAIAQEAGLGLDPETAEAQRIDNLETQRRTFEKLQAARKALDQHLASESVLTVIFNFIPSVKAKRALRARHAIGELMPEVEQAKQVSDIENKLSADHKAASKALTEAEIELTDCRTLRRNLALAESECGDAVAAIATSRNLSDPEDEADIGLRFNLFLLATHYWEGRWLLEMEADLAAIAASHNKTGKAKLIPRWHRRMMLTPCAVATFATLPSKLEYQRRDGGEFASEYLLNFIDLLIVDEAGQVLPEVAGASFSLAKRALIIGDTQQIEPISSLPRPVDIGNLRRYNLLAGETDISTISKSGICSTSGSAMRLAQQACRISPHPDLEKGLYLFEHRRCYDEIISFSNTLCYKGKLRPMRGEVAADAILPALGYLHIDGRAFSSGNSRINPLEAQTIAAWLDNNRSKLEQKYGEPLERIVGMVTPFGRQVREIRDACANRKIAVDEQNGITIGTVHALQGAERPVIIFSSVYSKHADGSFIDNSPSMLNVTVSRAKDSCLIFGDMDVIASAKAGSPREILADYLFNTEDNALSFVTEPRTDLSQDNSQSKMLRDAAEHDAFLLDALRRDGRQYTIVSPWVIASTMARAGLLAAFGDAIHRGAEINVYTDLLLNSSQTSGGQTQLEAVEKIFGQIGVRLHKLPKLHSKIVAVDNDLLCLGSYNWLSADRHGQYARHETSYAYRGKHLGDEIHIIIDSLQHREC